MVVITLWQPGYWKDINRLRRLKRLAPAESLMLTAFRSRCCCPQHALFTFPCSLSDLAHRLSGRKRHARVPVRPRVCVCAGTCNTTCQCEQLTLWFLMLLHQSAGTDSGFVATYLQPQTPVCFEGCAVCLSICCYTFYLTFAMNNNSTAAG